MREICRPPLRKPWLVLCGRRRGEWGLEWGASGPVAKITHTGGDAVTSLGAMLALPMLLRPLGLPPAGELLDPSASVIRLVT